MPQILIRIKTKILARSYSHILASSILLIILSCGIMDIRSYPFSSYYMYSDIFKPEIYTRQRIAVESDGTIHHSLRVRNILWPFWEASFLEALHFHRRVKSEKEFKTIISDLLNLVNHRIQKSEFLRNQVPMVEALILYNDNYVWTDFKRDMMLRIDDSNYLPKPNESKFIMRITQQDQD